MTSSPPTSDWICAQRLKILAEPHRLAILKLLLAGPLHVWEINARIAIEQSLLSHHLKILRQQGLVEAQRDGKAVLYRLTADTQSSGEYGLNLGCCTLAFSADSSSTIIE
ncbi:ArsR family transcriptional regulator [filamentous cyanobacterium CCP5]|nr:ArsR family transcriptional regulator [filamentous cyanobacterium CCP5]